VEVEGPKRPHGLIRNSDMASNFCLFKGAEAPPTGRLISCFAMPSHRPDDEPETSGIGSKRNYDVKVPLAASRHSADVPIAKWTSAYDPTWKFVPGIVIGFNGCGKRKLVEGIAYLSNSHPGSLIPARPLSDHALPTPIRDYHPRYDLSPSYGTD